MKQSLTGSTLIWFCELPKKSINSFETFCTLFMKKYWSHRRQVKTMRDLNKIEHKDDETPYEYLNPFLGIMNQIHDLDSKQAVVSFMHGLIPGSLLSDKCQKIF